MKSAAIVRTLLACLLLSLSSCDVPPPADPATQEVRQSLLSPIPFGFGTCPNNDYNNYILGGNILRIQLNNGDCYEKWISTYPNHFWAAPDLGNFGNSSYWIVRAKAILGGQITSLGIHNYANFYQFSTYNLNTFRPGYCLPGLPFVYCDEVGFVGDGRLHEIYLPFHATSAAVYAE